MSLRNHTSIIRIILFAIGILVVSTLIFSISSKVNSSQNITETILLDTLIVKKKEIPGYPDSVIMKWKGKESDRKNATTNWLESSGNGDQGSLDLKPTASAHAEAEKHVHEGIGEADRQT